MVGILKKMDFSNAGSTYMVEPQYTLVLNNDAVEMNQLVGHRVRLEYLHEIYCIKCGRKTSKSFGQGFCYPCFISAPETEECVLRPELCRAHEGIARDLEYAKEHCLINHYVYLAWSGGLKVGVTRYHQIPIRWVDQGATRAIKVCRTSNRFEAGRVEVELKKIFGDKTPWQAMLKGFEDDSINLITEKAKALEFINGKQLNYIPEPDDVFRLQYPVLQYPKKVSSVNFDNDDVIDDVIAGIRGQYIIFESSRVINIRKYSGYKVDLSYGNEKGL